jgi:hypothetical protein
MAGLIIEELVTETQQLIKDNWEEARNQEIGVNLFQILGISHMENYHSKFLAYLLDPSALHNCGPLFLDLFLKKLAEKAPSIPSPEDFVSSKARVGTEHFCGEKRDIDGVAIGGRIDIVIFPGNENQGKVMPIVIENKIYAGDQPDQLARAKNQFNGMCWLFYLTLDGKVTNDYSTKGLMPNNALEGYQSLSYSGFIYHWLSDCIEVASRPAIKHNINSYHLTVEQLTNQQSKFHKAMFNNLLESLSDTDDVLGTLTQLQNSVNRFLPDLNRMFANHLQSELGNNFKVEFTDSFGFRYQFIRVRPLNWKSNYIAIGFDARNKATKRFEDSESPYRDGNISICSDSPVNREDAKNLKQKLTSKDLAFFKNFEDENTEAPFFYCYNYFSDFGIHSNDWDSSTILKMNDTEFAKPYAEAIKLVYTKVKELDDTTWL